ncbi:MAG: 6-phosphofructokinase [Chloracidobacterium sp. CP2_5A]|nr:MAG: 6-phosphofructokinase [Chloracidobacterium sp. CP2_5A]
MRTLGVLTGGGDAPGLNAALRAVVRRAMQYGIRVLGIHQGWNGLINGRVEPLTRYSISGILPRGGTILGTSRINPLETDEIAERVKTNWRKYELDALVVIGGEGTLSAALEMHRRHGYPIVGVPKTIDNDLCGTDATFGFDTALSVATEAIDRLHTTAESHDRVMVVEVMGRHAGWIAAGAGIAGGADIVLVPEHPFRISEVCQILNHRKSLGRFFSIIVVAEDAHPHPDEDFLAPEERERVFQHTRLGGIGHLLARKIEELTGIETRVTVLGYTQRGGVPTAYDRLLATRLGVKAVDMVRAGEFGYMAALQGTRMASVPIEQAVSCIKRLDDELYETARVFFG